MLKSRRTVRYQPVLPLRTALGWMPASRLERPFPLMQPRAVLTYSGTAAIYQAVRALQLPAGSVVLCPSYNCGHEIEPILRLGLRVECYRVDREMELDLADVERRIYAGVRALLVTHYFGFPQQLDAVRALCDRHGIALIEDCAHAFLSDNAAGTLGRVGNVAIYSIRKSLSLPNGGVVLFNDPSLPLPDPLDPPPALSTWLKTLDLTTKSVLDRIRGRRAWRDVVPLAALVPVMAGSSLVRRFYPISVARYDPDDEDFNFASPILNWSASAFSQALLDRIDWRNVASQRRANYRRLVEGLDGIPGCRAIRPEIPDHVVPLFLPIAVAGRRELFRHLVRHRIHSAIWWDQHHPAVAWDQFPDAVVLKESVLALPVHQDLDPEQLDVMVGALRRYAGQSRECA